MIFSLHSTVYYIFYSRSTGQIYLKLVTALGSSGEPYDRQQESRGFKSYKKFQATNLSRGILSRGIDYTGTDAYYEKRNSQNKLRIPTLIMLHTPP